MRYHQYQVRNSVQEMKNERKPKVYVYTSIENRKSVITKDKKLKQNYLLMNDVYFYLSIYL